MYFVECERALREIRRVLKSEGRIALLVWGMPEQSPYMQSVLGPILQRAQLSPPQPGEPQPFRFASPGALTAELEQAGFQQINEEAHVIPMPWPGPPEELWRHVYEIAAPFRPVVDSLLPAERDRAIGEVLVGLRRYYDGERTNAPAAIVVASATR